MIYGWGEHHQLTASRSSKPNDSNVEEQTLIRKKMQTLSPTLLTEPTRPSLLCSITGPLISALLWPSHEPQLMLALLALTKTVMKRASDWTQHPHQLWNHAMNCRLQFWFADGLRKPQTPSADAASSRVCSCSEVLVSDLHLVDLTDVSRFGSDLESVSVPV